MEKLIGIDLGTTNSVVATYEGNTPIIVPNNRGGRLTPSVVAFSKDGEILVGQSARNQTIINSERTIASIKRKMGTKFQVRIDNKNYSPEEISALILRKLKKDAEEYLACEIRQAVITVPAYFNDAQRQATINAGRIAGIDVIRIINEPTAAALAYGLNDHEDQIIMVFDIGGGTYDVSVLEIGNGVFQVLGTSGNNHLGGDDFDQRLINYVIDEYKQNQAIDLNTDRMALQRLREEVEKVKIELSEATIATLSIPFITATSQGPKHLEMKISRSVFENLIADLVDSIEKPAQLALKDARISPEMIDKVLLVGGSTRIPIIQEKITRLTGKELFKNVNPDECVALGAAIQCAIVKGSTQGVVLVDVIPMTLGIEVEGGEFIPIINRNTSIPVSKTKMFTTIADNQELVEVKVYQGERKIASANKHLGDFQLTGIRKAVKGEPRIEVTFDVNVDGILHVSARDIDTGANQTIVLKDASGLSESQIHKMMEDARLFEQQDKNYIHRMNLLNQAEGLILSGNNLLCSLTENKMEDHYAELILDLKEGLNELEKQKMKNDTESLNAMVEAVEALLNQIPQIKTPAVNSSAEQNLPSDETIVRHLKQEDLGMLEK